jgi:hypothetical protein
MNNKSVITILTVFLLSFLCGCQNNQNQPTELVAPGDIIKLSDIQPTHKIQTPTEMVIKMFTYELPAENIQYLDEIYDEISESHLRYPDLDLFKENGFEAGFATEPVWPIISDALYRASAQNVLTSNLLFLDSATNRIPAAETYNKQSFYLHKRRGEPELVKLPTGQLLFEVKARALPDGGGYGLVQIEAMHQKNILPTLTNIPGYENAGKTIFNQISFKLNMTVGEFVVLGPSLDESDRVTLADLFFKRTGDIFVPIETEIDSDKIMTPKYRIEKNIPLIRLYVFACVGIKN